MDPHESIQPFWQKLPFFLKYPLHFGPLVFITSMSVASIFTVFASGLFKGLLLILFLRYAFTIMEMGARGRFNPESGDISVWGKGDMRPIKQSAVLLFYGVILVVLSILATRPNQPTPNTPAKSALSANANPAASGTGTDSTAHPTGGGERNADDQEDDDSPGNEMDASADAGADANGLTKSDREALERMARQHAKDEEMQRSSASSGKTSLWASVMHNPNRRLAPWFYILAVLCALPLPASIMVIAIDDNLLRSLNPATFFFFVKGMGRAYFVLWLFFALIFLGRESLMLLFPATMSPFITTPLEMFFSFYLMLALYSMMGYALYQYHQQLDNDVMVDFQAYHAKESEAANPTDPLTRKINAAIADGNIDRAIGFVEDELRYVRLDPALNQRLYDLLMTKGDNEKILQQGERLMKALISVDQAAKVMPVLRKLQEIDPAYEITGTMILPVAKVMVAQRDYVRATALVKGFDRNYPEHPDIPGIYLLSAHIASEHLRKDEMAVKILKMLLQRFPACEQAEEAQGYLNLLERVAKSAAAAAQKSGA